MFRRCHTECPVISPAAGSSRKPYIARRIGVIVLSVYDIDCPARKHGNGDRCYHTRIGRTCHRDRRILFNSGGRWWRVEATRAQRPHGRAHGPCYRRIR